MRPYLEKLVQLRSEQENMLLGLLMEDYVAYIDALVQQTNIMDKQFYVVVPYFPTIDISKPVEAGKKVFSGFFELFKINKSAGNEVITINEGELGKAKQELKNRVQSVVGGLNQMSVQAIPLDTQELIELLGLTFPLGYGLDYMEFANKTGAYYEVRRSIIHATNFILRADGTVAHAVYASGPIGRLTPEDCLRVLC